jgi:hypothetical protein
MGEASDVRFRCTRLTGFREATPHPDWIPGRLLLTVGFVMALTGRNSAVFLAIDSGYHGGEQLPERGS